MSQTSTLITLTTDFGHKGPFVAVVKGVIHRHAPAAKVVDLTHEIHVHWPAEAGFWVGRAFAYFPTGSIHVAVVDPGVGTERDIIVASAAEHRFLAPDNGILPLALQSVADVTAYRLDHDWLAEQGWPQPSQTFHGRDIFAPLAGELAAGRVSSADVGPPVAIDELVPPLIDEPMVARGEVQGAVIAIDHFGNLISNIGAELVAALDSPSVRVAGQHLGLEDTYGRARPGEFLALINSFDVLEIARAEGSAADSLGLSVGAPIVVSSRA